MATTKTVIVAAGIAASALSCTTDASPPDASSNAGSYVKKLERKIAGDLTRGLPTACPPSAANDEDARTACSRALASLPVLRDFSSDPFMWGMQTSRVDGTFDDAAASALDPLVFRETYLSLFTIVGDPSAETSGGRTILRVPARFRDALPLGTYPYPFWHSPSEWDSYRFTTELLFVLDRGKITGALRSARELR